MSFTEAVQSGLTNYVTFNGRSSRSAYWWFWLFTFVAVIAAEIVSAIIKSPVIYLIVALALLLPSLAVAIRRLHDTGRTGWWLLIGLIPIIGTITLIVFYVQDSDGPNQYGDRPDDTTDAGLSPIAG